MTLPFLSASSVVRSVVCRRVAQAMLRMGVLYQVVTTETHSFGCALRCVPTDCSPGPLPLYRGGYPRELLQVSDVGQNYCAVLWVKWLSIEPPPSLVPYFPARFSFNTHT
jgi:hypothetical protein